MVMMMNKKEGSMGSDGDESFPPRAVVGEHGQGDDGDLCYAYNMI